LQIKQFIVGLIDFAFFRRAIQSHTIRYRFQGISDRAEDIEQILPCRVLFINHPITNQSFFSIISPHPIQSTPCLVAHDDAHHEKW